MLYMKKLKNSRVNFRIVIVAAVLLVLYVAQGVFAYMNTPQSLRKPSFEHLHFRTQISVNGTPVDFASDPFQASYDASSCSADLTEEPFHFHDKNDQMTHVHWRDMTGGQFLKYYGWNYIEGPNDSLGLRYDKNILFPEKVKIAGKLLPELNQRMNLYIYIGDEAGYTQISKEDFVSGTFEEIFKRESRIPKLETSILDALFPKAYAHDGEEHTEGNLNLEQINNLLGNLVIFAQETEPAAEEIVAKFNNLVPLSASTCGG